MGNKAYEGDKPMPRKFVRYKEGAEMYGMGLSKFQELAKEAHATYKLNQTYIRQKRQR